MAASFILLLKGIPTSPATTQNPAVPSPGHMDGKFVSDFFVYNLLFTNRVSIIAASLIQFFLDNSPQTVEHSVHKFTEAWYADLNNAVSILSLSIIN